MNIKRNGSQHADKGPENYFTGDVSVTAIFDAADPGRVQVASVRFEPGGRTTWHTHPLGQTLIVTAGIGRVQLWGNPIQEILPGDVVLISPGEKHWHGASPDSSMTHIAAQQKANGKVAEWMEPVSDAQYRG